MIKQINAVKNHMNEISPQSAETLLAIDKLGPKENQLKECCDNLDL